MAQGNGMATAEGVGRGNATPLLLDADFASALAKAMRKENEPMIARKVIYDNSVKKISEHQTSRRTIALAVMAPLLGMLVYYVNLRMGQLDTNAAATALRSSMSRYVLCAIMLMLYFISLRGVGYQKDEVSSINAALPYEAEFAGGTGEAHNAAGGYRDKFWSYSNIDMVVFGFGMATFSTFVFDIFHF